MKEKPFFSVIIPLYNKKRSIERAVNCVLNQSFSDFEVLVVDDGSTDDGVGSLATITDDRLRIIHQENKGGAGGQARNTGMSQANGSWFAFLDADDLWLPNHLEELVAIIDEAQQPALISTKPIELNEGEELGDCKAAARSVRKIDYFRESARAVGLNNCSSSAIHREIFDRLGGFIYARSGPDLEYWARVALHYPVFLSSMVTSIYYRGNMGNMEQLARDRGQTQKPIRELSDVSPSLAMLAQFAEKDPSILRREDIRLYINGRLRSGMRGNIRQSMPSRARALRRLMIEPVDNHVRLLGLASWCPIVVLKFLNFGYGLLRT
ncbi:glycosyltransferase family 2 protein [Alloalcanivorax venustensis]|uniref:glycosyltransferase family 2 protein n=1 Tax=Alloalcanivorax venustensis TaxID=172371 RepID=UPI0035173AB8